MDDIFVYLVDLPHAVNEMSCPCADGYTVYIDKNLPQAKILKAIRHAISHILHEDWGRDDIQRIERDAHGREEDPDSLPLPQVFIRLPE